MTGSQPKTESFERSSFPKVSWRKRTDGRRADDLSEKPNEKTRLLYFTDDGIDMVWVEHDFVTAGPVDRMRAQPRLASAYRAPGIAQPQRVDAVEDGRSGGRGDGGSP